MKSIDMFEEWLVLQLDEHASRVLRSIKDTKPLTHKIKFEYYVVLKRVTNKITKGGVI